MSQPNELPPAAESTKPRLLVMPSRRRDCHQQRTKALRRIHHGMHSVVTRYLANTHLVVRRILDPEVK